MVGRDSCEMFDEEVRKKLQEAAEQFNLPQILATRVRFDLKGNSAGQAILRQNQHILRFNREAIERSYESMIKDVLPHEVAHLVCFSDPTLGKNHNPGWSSVAKSLGGTGNRHHDIKLTSARRVRRYVYVLSDGSELKLTKTQHTRLQQGDATYHAREHHTRSGTCLPIPKSGFVEEVLVL